MDMRRALILTAGLPALAAAALVLTPAAHSGHEIPVYPPYYPHKIEIAVVEPQQAGELLGKGKLHAYVSGTPGFAAAPPKEVASVPSLGEGTVCRRRGPSAGG